MKTSIIMTSYNYGKYITQAIESVIHQSITDWELIIIDDGSKDNSLNIINEYVEKDSRIKLFTHPKHQNKGLKASLRLGIENAENDWIAFLESDDFWSIDYLEEKIKMINKYPNCGLFYNDVECFGNTKKELELKPYFDRLYKLWEKEEVKNIFEYFSTENPVPTFSCVMCKKSELLKCNLNPVAEAVSDYWLWWQIAQENDFCFIKNKLTFWRLHNSSYMEKSSTSFLHQIQRAQFFSKITKILKRTPKICPQNLPKAHPLISIPAHILIYFRNKIKH